MQIKSLRIKSYRSWTIADIASLLLGCKGIYLRFTV